MSQNRERRLNELLAKCEAIYQPIATSIDRLKAPEPPAIPENLKRPLASMAYFMMEKIDEVAKIFKQVTLESAIQGIAPRPLLLYRNELSPNREFFGKLLFKLLDMSDIQEQREESASPVWNVLLSGHDS